MSYGKTKVYFDGSHYIAIPHRKRFIRKWIRQTIPNKNIVEEGSTVQQKSVISIKETTHLSHAEICEEILDKENICYSEAVEKRFSVKEVFEKHYKESKTKNKIDRRNLIIDNIKSCFNTEVEAEEYVNVQLQRKARNLIVRRVRCLRKANLQAFNYFVTFTYDSKKHTEDSFKAKLKTCLKNLVNRKKWRYMGVWERSPEKNRLHFHGLFFIPENTMPGFIIDVTDFSFKTNNMQTTHQNVYFNELLGRSDFEVIEDRSKYIESVNYLLKYIEKSEDKIVYSKDLPQYFISDIEEEDIICNFGLEDKKLLLFDDFKCWEAGELVGTVSTNTIAQLRKSN